MILGGSKVTAASTALGFGVWGLGFGVWGLHQELGSEVLFTIIITIISQTTHIKLNVTEANSFVITCSKNTHLIQRIGVDVRGRGAHVVCYDV